MARAIKRVASASGAATADVSDFASRLMQVTIDNISTGTGTVTITAVPAEAVDATPLADGTIDLADATAPKCLLIDGDVTSVIATSDQSGDSFDLLVTALPR